ncbi:hypothetical protein [Vibrio metschnikovii]|uniref:hypothetical protein n=1 Tax=Vibrio metschnikovii TaxID=28172 RepID=UPI002FC5B267
MAKFGALFMLLVASSSSLAATLVTKNYVVSITPNCVEGEVTCNDVTYRGKSKKSGNEIILKGHTLHALLSDGTPSRFLGYKFINGNVVYMVSDSGSLIVTLDEKVLVNEQGQWN